MRLFNIVFLCGLLSLSTAIDLKGKTIFDFVKNVLRKEFLVGVRVLSQWSAKRNLTPK